MSKYSPHLQLLVIKFLCS